MSPPCLTVSGYHCYANFCASDSPVHKSGPTCGPELAELRLGGSTDIERIHLAQQWCNLNSSCSGFALDFGNPVTLTYSSKNFTTAAVFNTDWSSWWTGDLPPPPLPQPSPQPSPKPTPHPDPPVPPQPYPKWIPCKNNLGCQLSGVCNVTTQRCKCDKGWTGENCELMHLVPPVRGQGTCDPSLNGTAVNFTTTWGGRPIQDQETGIWHCHVAEMAKHCGMCRWSSVSQVGHYVSDAPPLVKSV